MSATLDYYGFMKINPAKTITESITAKYSKKAEAIRRGKDIRENIKKLLASTKDNTAQKISDDLDVNLKSLYPILLKMETKGEIKKGKKIKGLKNKPTSIYVLTKKDSDYQEFRL